MTHKPPFYTALLVCILFACLQLNALSQTTTKAPVMHPPLDGVDVPYESFSFDAGTCQGYTYETGSQLCIEPNSFVTSAGVPARGTITVRYRELHTVAAMVASGVPMYIQMGGKRSQLESAGMFELLADQNGEPLQLAPGKQVRIRMAAQRILPNLKVYYLDPVKGWQEEQLPVSEATLTPGATADASPAVWEDEWVDADETFSEFDEGGDTFEGPPSEMAVYSTEVFRDLGISSMGMYNYDAIMKEDDPVRIVASLELPADVKPEEVVLYCIYRDVNTVYYFTAYDLKEQFYLLRDKPVQLFAILPGKRVAVVPTSFWSGFSYDKAAAAKPFVFKMEVLPGAVTSLTGLKVLLGIS